MKILIAGASGGIGHFLTVSLDSKGNELLLTYNSSKESVYKTKHSQSKILKCHYHTMPVEWVEKILYK
jgi:short-subunit dehydrogenase